METRKANSVCARLAATVSLSKTEVDTNENGILPPRLTIDGPHHNFVAAKVRRPVLYNAHNPASARHAGSRGMFHTMRRRITGPTWPRRYSDWWKHSWPFSDIFRPINTKSASTASPSVTSGTCCNENFAYFPKTSTKNRIFVGKMDLF